MHPNSNISKALITLGMMSLRSLVWVKKEKIKNIMKSSNHLYQLPISEIFRSPVATPDFNSHAP